MKNANWRALMPEVVSTTHHGYLLSQRNERSSSVASSTSCSLEMISLLHQADHAAARVKAMKCHICRIRWDRITSIHASLGGLCQSLFCSYNSFFYSAIFVRRPPFRLFPKSLRFNVLTEILLLFPTSLTILPTDPDTVMERMIASGASSLASWRR